VTAQVRDSEHLRRIPFFEDLTPEDLERIATIGERRSFAPGETIVAKDTEGQALFVVLSGRATVEAGGKVHQLGPGHSLERWPCWGDGGDRPQ
jgi:CRP-like cAMP-binding protein